MACFKQIISKYKKTTLLCFQIENKISINGVNLQYVDSKKCLGVCIDDHITWKDNITNI